MKLVHILYPLILSVSTFTAVEGAIVRTSGVYNLVGRGLPKLATTSSTPIPSSTSTSSTDEQSITSSESSSLVESFTSTSNSEINSSVSSTAFISVPTSDSTAIIEATPSIASVNSSYSNASSITYIKPSAISIPSAENNKYVYHVKHPSGTVYTASGSCLGFIILVLAFVWLAFAIKSWKSARNEYKIRERETQYQYDPYSFQYYDGDGFSSDSDMASDISEKVLKQKSSRMSLYSLGGGSAFNLLSSEKVNEKPQSQSTNNPRFSMFISPTEILKSEGNNWSSAENSNINSVSSTPKEQSMTQIIMNPVSRSSFNENFLLDNAVSKLQVQGTTEPAPIRSNDNKKGRARPPSALLDQLLDDC